MGWDPASGLGLEGRKDVGESRGVEKERALELVDNRWNQTERWGGVNDGADRIRQEKERWDGSGGHQDKEPGRMDESGKGTWSLSVARNLEN